MKSWSLDALGGSGNLEILDREECRSLLASRQVGRLAYSGAFGPRIVPLNYTLVDQFILFRTGPGSDAAREIPQRWVAFEVDDIDEFLRAGWSVEVRGFAELLPTDSIRMLDVPQTPEPWPKGDHSLLIRLSLSELTGRRVQAGA